MGLQDREYMRGRKGRDEGHSRVFGYRPPLDRKFRLSAWQKWLGVAAATITVVSMGVWLVRDTSNLAVSFYSGPAEGSIVVNINTASQEELESIPGIGPSYAAQIIARRPFQSVEELTQISGIGPATLDSIRPFVTTEGENRRR